MQLGNRLQLDHERNTLRDAFDSRWFCNDVLGHAEIRAMRCAIRLDCPPHVARGGNWTILSAGVRVTAPAIIHA